MKIPSNNRILCEYKLQPLQGNRIQPTGFPNIDTCVFSYYDGTKVAEALLIESSQSVANRLEEPCLNGDSLCELLQGMPIITVKKDGKYITNSIRESHRIGSRFIYPTIIKNTKEMLNNITLSNGLKKLAKYIFSIDPNTLLHGTWIAKLEGGKYRFTRIVSGYIEGENINTVVSGGVKIDSVDASGKSGGGSSEGAGNIIYNKTEYTAKTITAYFSIDVSLLKSYDLDETAEEFLYTLCLWKISKFLTNGLRLRTACDLEVIENSEIIKPNNIIIPPISELESDLTKLITECKNKDLFSEPLVIDYDGSK